MGYFFDTFWFEPGSRMTGIWDAAPELPDGAEVVATASLVRLGPDQHDVLEADFLSSHLPFQLGGFHGVGPDGQPWALILQVAPAKLAVLVGSDNEYWPLVDGLNRALEHNPEASLISDRGFTRQDVVDIYEEQGVDDVEVWFWSLPELLLGLLAECCYVNLPKIVAGMVGECAFPELVHDCQHDGFADVFSMWTSGRLNPPEESG